MVDGQEAWVEAGRRLREVEPQGFARLLALARAFVAIHDRSMEDDAVFASRLTQIRGDKPKALA